MKTSKLIITATGYKTEEKPKPKEVTK